MGFFVSRQKLSPTTSSLFIILLCFHLLHDSCSKETKEMKVKEFTHAEDSKMSDLDQAESKDGTNSEIIKQIRRVNSDGTYTIGYEADDGTFKIESRDVLGNVKGTYGYIDDDGEIKRVSYTANNMTGLKDLEQPVSEQVDEPITPAALTLIRYNRTFSSGSTTRRPNSLAYLTSTAGPTKPSVIQNIPNPKRRLFLSGDRTTLRSSETTPAMIDSTTSVVYATSVPTPKPFIMLRPTGMPDYQNMRSNDQMVRPEKIEIDTVSKVFISKSKEMSTVKPKVEKEKDEEKHTKHEVRGNILRRQLKMEEEGLEGQSQVLYGQSAGEEGERVYGGGFGSVRPLFSTTTSPKLPSQLIAARQRATQLQNILGTSSPSTTTEKVYVKPPKRQSLLKQRIKEEEVPEPTSENKYHTQTPVVQIPSNAITEAEAADERRPFRERSLPPQLEQLYRPRNYLRQLPNQQYQQPLQGVQGQNFPNALTERAFAERGGAFTERNFADRGALLGERGAIPDRGGFRTSSQIPNDKQFHRETSAKDFRQPSEGAPQNAQRFAAQYQQPQQAYSDPVESFPAAQPYFNRQPDSYYDRPLTVRDFERLLHLLIGRQTQYGRFNPYSNFNSPNPSAFPPFIPPYNQPYAQIPRPPYYGNNFGGGLYDPHYQNPYYSSSNQISQQYGDHGGSGERGLYQAQTQQPLADNQSGFDIQRISPRRRPYDPRLVLPAQPAASEQEINYNSLQQSNTGFLPSDVRENLLYRMLMLAIQNDPQYSAQAASTNSHAIVEPQMDASNMKMNSKPVRSVQILGEEEEE